MVAITAAKKKKKKRLFFTTALHSLWTWLIVSAADLAKGRAESSECVAEMEKPPHTFSLVPAAEELLCTVYLRPAFLCLSEQNTYWWLQTGF